MLIIGVVWAEEDCFKLEVCSNEFGRSTCRQTCRAANILERIAENLEKK